jgi:2,3-bisphosphoglycerate-independent phosphoglycerate mutase
MSASVKPFVLIIMDGWGYSEDPEHNAIYHANTPHWDEIFKSNPQTFISGSGMDVGLPQGQMGNSEVGHLNLGAGRVVYQEFTRISKSIQDGDFYSNQALSNSVQHAIDNDGSVHLMGLLSPGGVHSHESHFDAMIELAKKQGAKKIYVHAFLDGRDTPPRSAAESIERLENKIAAIEGAKIATIVGRYYAMDRDQRWERIQSAYNMLVNADAEFHYSTALEALEAAYARDENDEFVKPTIIGEPIQIIDGDAVIFMNFRADRARQLSRAFVDDNFGSFARAEKKQVHFVCLTQYAASIKAHVAYPPVALDNVLGEYLQDQGKTQLRIAETEKYAHVTFFFNGGREEAFRNEERILISSPNVATYDLQPEMSAPELTERLIESIESQAYDVIICNYANPDMVGHTGNFPAAVKAVEALDSCIGQVVSSLRKVGGEAIITADHGNVEKMFNNSTGQRHTAHTSNVVPFVYVGRAAEVIKTDGVLSDVAPTMLNLLGLEIPAEMSGKPIFQLLSNKHS